MGAAAPEVMRLPVRERKLLMSLLNLLQRAAATLAIAAFIVGTGLAGLSYAHEEGEGTSSSSSGEYSSSSSTSSTSSGTDHSSSDDLTSSSSSTVH